MCRKVRVMYKCRHRVTEEVKNCCPWHERKHILNANGECPNDVMAISMDLKNLCMLCELRLQWEAENPGKPGTNKDPPPISPQKPFEHYRRHVAAHVEDAHRLAKIIEEEETTDEEVAELLAKLRMDGWEPFLVKKNEKQEIEEENERLSGRRSEEG